MPSKYDPGKALPLRVPSDVRARLDALVDLVPPALRLPRNSVAVAALVRGVEALRAELARDPMAVHRALAGVSSEHAPAALPSTAITSTAPDPRAGADRPERAPATVEGATAKQTPRVTAPVVVDSAALLKRWRRAGLPLLTFCRRHGIARSVMQAWLAGREAKPSTLARVAAGLDVEGK